MHFSVRGREYSPGGWGWGCFQPLSHPSWERPLADVYTWGRLQQLDVGTSVCSFKAPNGTSSVSGRLLPNTGLTQARQDGLQPPLPQKLIYPQAKPPRVLACLLHGFVLAAGHPLLPGQGWRSAVPARLPWGFQLKREDALPGEGVLLGFSVGGSRSRQVEEDGGRACGRAGLLGLFSWRCSCSPSRSNSSMLPPCQWAKCTPYGLLPLYDLPSHSFPSFLFFFFSYASFSIPHLRAQHLGRTLTPELYLSQGLGAFLSSSPGISRARE